MTVQLTIHDTCIPLLVNKAQCILAPASNRESTSKTDMEEKKLLNTVIFLFSLRTKGG